MNFDWDDIRFFLAVARSGTMSAAAEVLNVNYTTVSRRIKNFEKQMNVQLFHHTPDGYITTEAAREIVGQAERIEADFHTIGRQLFGKQSDIQGDLCITLPPSVAKNLILPYMKEFQDLYPEIKLLITSSSEMANLGVRDADIAIRIARRLPENLIGQCISQLGYAVYGEKNYLKKYPKTDKNNMKLLTLTGKITEEHSKALLKSHPNIKPGIHISGFGSLENAIENELGIGILPCFLGDKNPRLNKLPIKVPANDWGLWLLSHPDYRHSTRVKVFKEFFAKKLKQNKESIQGKDF